MSSDRETEHLEASLGHAEAYIARITPILRELRDRWGVAQASKFWKLRNGWFRLKRALGRTSAEPLAPWLPSQDGLWYTRLSDTPYEIWKARNRFREADARRAKKIIHGLALRPQFSILMPVFNPDERYVREAIESVRSQVYEDWQLCIADDRSTNPSIRRILEEYAALDERIVVDFRETNGHIAAATNTALARASGEFIALLDHDDVLAPHALFANLVEVNRDPTLDVIFSDEDKIDDRGRRYMPFFKPDWSPESLLSRNVVSHFGVFRRSLVLEAGGFRVGFEGSQDYDLVLRLTERTDRIAHIPDVLYHWRAHEGSSASQRDQKSYAQEAARRAVREALERRGEAATVNEVPGAAGVLSVRFALPHEPHVTIIIPTRDHASDLSRCLTSIFERSTYRAFDVLIVDNGSADPGALELMASWTQREAERVRIMRVDEAFNFARLNNRAAATARGTHLLFLNNDTEVISRDWIEGLVEQSRRRPIGVAGAKLLYDDGTIQHAGVVVGLGGVAGHGHKGFPGDAPGYFYALQAITNVSAVTAACAMVRRDVFDEVGGFDERLAVAFNDVDFCLRVREAGYRNVYLPHVVLRHYESRSRGYENTPEKQQRFLAEQQFMKDRWKTDRVPDPYYSIHLSLDTETYDIRP